MPGRAELVEAQVVVGQLRRPVGDRCHPDIVDEHYCVWVANGQRTASYGRDVCW